MYLVDCSNSFLKPDKIDLAFLVFLLFIMLCNVTFCVENEDVSLQVVNGLYISGSSNFFKSDSGRVVAYFFTEPGYIYHIHFSNWAHCASFTGVPELNKPYNYIGIFSPNSSFDYLSTNSNVLSFGFSDNPAVISVTREKLTDMEGTVKILSNDVGTNQFWNTFTLAIPFILIVVIVVLGFFIIRRLLKKDSKGDIRF